MSSSPTIQDAARWARVHPVMVRKINAWRLSPRAKAVAFEINDLSFGEGRPEVELWQHELASLTGYSEPCTAKAVDQLQSEGVLQVIGRRGGTRVFRLLPSAEMIEPEARPDAGVAAAVRAVVRERNGGRRPGDEPGGQRPLLQIPEERLRDEQASASADQALEDDARERGLANGGGPPPQELPADWRERMQASILGNEDARGGGGEVAGVASPPGKLPGGQLRQVASLATLVRSEGGARTRVGETLNVRTINDNVERSNEGCGPVVVPAAPAEMTSEAVYAFELVQSVANRGEFEAYRRRWVERCKREPLLVAEMAADVRDRIRTGEKIPNAGGYIFKTVRDMCRKAGRFFRILI